MPQTRRLIGAAGARFTHSYVSTPLCCPSRATYLTGQYAHNNGVLSNTPPHGGVEALDAQHTLPVWLRGRRLPHLAHRQVPQRLRAAAQARRPARLERLARHRRQEHVPDVRLQAVRERDAQPVRQLRRRGPGALPDRRAAPEGGRVDRGDGGPTTPLFLSLMFVAPHGEVETPGRTTQPYIRPAPRHVGALRRACPSRARSAASATSATSRPTSARLHRSNPSTAARVRADFRARRESLLAVDEAVARRRRRRSSAPGGSTRPTSSSPPTTASSRASTASSRASTSPTTRPRTCRC